MKARDKPLADRNRRCVLFSRSAVLPGRRATPIRLLSKALDLVEDNNARQAVAVLADAARQYPQDRKIGALLYTLLRDKRWPLPATLPVKLPAAITV